MIVNDILAERRSRLIKIVRSSFVSCEPHSQAFARRVLETDSVTIRNLWAQGEPQTYNAEYGGYPQLARLGFAIASNSENLDTHAKKRFTGGVDRLRLRTQPGLETFSADDVAILGLADGLSHFVKGQESSDLIDNTRWLGTIVEQPLTSRAWSYRMRMLSGDLIDQRGRLRTAPDYNDVDVGALELTLRAVWPDPFNDTIPPSRKVCESLIGLFLTREPPDVGELERAVAWLKALDVLLSRAIMSLLPEREEDAIGLISNVKSALDRKAKSRTQLRLWSLLGWLILAVVLILFLIGFLGWDVMEPWTYALGLGIGLFSLVYFIITQKSLSPETIYLQMLDTRKMAVYKEFNFDIQEYEHLIEIIVVSETDT